MSPENISANQAEGLPAMIPCPACRRGTASFSFQKDGYDLFSCSACDFLFVHPFPDDEALTKHYGNSYRGAVETYYPKAGSRRWRAFWRSLNYIGYVHRKRVLDVGCGGGFMVEAFARLGGDAYGMDVSRNSIAYAKKHFGADRFFCESFRDFAARGKVFDFVFSSEVLEHLPGPDEFLWFLGQVVAPGGFVYVSAPDASHPRVPTDISQWSDICPPEHLQFYGKRSLDILFGAWGFELHRREPHKTPAHSVIYRRST